MQKLFSAALAAVLCLGAVISFPHPAHSDLSASLEEEPAYNSMLPDYGIMLLEGKFPDGAGDIQ